MDDDRQPQDLGATRTGEQLATDGAAVVRQRGALGAGRRSRAFHKRITALIVERRRHAGPEVEQFDVVSDGTPGGTPVVRGALLVRAGLPEQDPELFGRLVERVGEPASHLDGRLLVLAGRGAEPAQLVELAREVRRRGFEASVDHILPLDIVCKGEGGPAPTSLASTASAPRPQPEGVSVAVIDTGVAVKGREHDWHAGLHGADNLDPLDAFPAPGGDGLLDAAAGHGAFATGIVQQVAPAARVQVHQAIDSDGIGSEVRVAEALLTAVRKGGAEIVNLSLGTRTVDDQPLLALQIAFELLSEAGHDDVLLVAAAGNFGDTRPCWPAAFRRVVAVAGLTAELAPAAWSSHGHWVDVSTVGEGVVSTYVRGTESPTLGPDLGPDDWPLSDPQPWAVWTGTSFAAPQVAGAVAAGLGALRAGGDRLATPRTVLRSLLEQGRRLPDHGVALRILAGTPIPP